MLVRIAYMIFLAGGAVWLWAAGLSISMMWAIGYGAVLIVLGATGMSSQCSCRESSVCRPPRVTCAFFFACIGVGLAIWTIAHGGLTTIADNWDMDDVGRAVAWPVIIVCTPFVNDFLRWKMRKHEPAAPDESANGAQRSWGREDWKGG